MIKSKLYRILYRNYVESFYPKATHPSNKCLTENSEQNIILPILLQYNVADISNIIYFMRTLPK